TLGHASGPGDEPVVEFDFVDRVDPRHRLRDAVPFFGCGVERTVEAIAGELAGHDAAPGRRPPIGEGEDEGERLDAAVGRDADVELAVALSAALAGVGVLGAVAGLLGDAPVAGRVMAVDLAVALDRARGRGHGRARA